MPKQEPVIKGMAAIDIELGACLTAPTKRLIADLHEAARECNRARNGMARFWQRWMEDNPNYQPRQKTTRKGDGKFKYVKIEEADLPKGVSFLGEKKSGSGASAKYVAESIDGQYSRRINAAGDTLYYKRSDAMLENAWLPQDVTNAMYHRGGEIAPKLASKIVAQLRKDVVDYLDGNMPYTHKRIGVAKKKWEAIQLLEDSMPRWRETIIPVPSQDTILCYMGERSRDIGKWDPREVDKDFDKCGVNEQVRRMGLSTCVIRFPLFSRKAGRENTAVCVRLNISKMKQGRRALLMRIAKREWDLRDSRLIFKRGRWVLQLCYYQPRLNMGLDQNRKAELVIDGPKSNRPFKVAFDDYSWQIGDSNVLKSEYTSLVIRRKALQHRYKTKGEGTSRGHGKGRFFEKFRPYSRATEDLQAQFTWHAIKDVIKFCVRNNCGTLEYREPTLPLREARSWFSRNGIPYNWTIFLNNLKHKCAIYNITLVIDRMSFAEYRERYDDNDAAREAQNVHPTHVATMQFEEGSGKRGHQRAPLATGTVKRGANGTCDAEGGNG